MSHVPLAAFLALGLALFAIGAVGVVVRRSPLVMFMCIELMLNAVNLTLVAFARYGPNLLSNGSDGMVRSALSGEMLVIFVMAVAAAEVAVGLGIITAIFRLREVADIDDVSAMRG